MKSLRTNLLTLYLRYDFNFKTISTVALSELVLKILYFGGKSMSLKEIKSKIEEIINSDIDYHLLDSILSKLLRTDVLFNNNKYVLSDPKKADIQSMQMDSDSLHQKVLKSYFNNTRISPEDVLAWFQEIMIIFFEAYNFQWIQIATSKNKNSINFQNIDDIARRSFSNRSFSPTDQVWLTSQFKKFINDSNPEIDQLFAQYGLASFSARLINAKNFANKINIDAFRGTTFLLDTNVLMILDLESHLLNGSIAKLESVLSTLDIKLEYLYVTKEEYRGAMAWKRGQLKSVFEEYDENILRQSDCPFIRTAIHRKCQNTEDINRMFDSLENIPSKFSNIIDINIKEEPALEEIISQGSNDSILKDKLNTIYKRYKGYDKKDPALTHDTGLIAATYYLRENGGKYIILTNDTILKRYSVENPIRDEIGIAIGLDALISLLVVNGGGTNLDPSDFAPLFKNIVRLSLYPSQEAFRVEDLSFILGVNLEIQKLPDDKVISLAKSVNQKLCAGVHADEIALFLRREIESERLSQISKGQQEDREKDLLKNEVHAANQKLTLMRQARFKDIKRKMIRRIWTYRIIFLFLILGLCICEFFIIKNRFDAPWISEIVTILLAMLSFIPFNKYVLKKYPIDEETIYKQIDRESNLE